MTVAVPHSLMKPVMDLVQAKTGLAVAVQDLHISSKEMKPLNMLGMTPDERTDKLVELRNAVPDLLHGGVKRRHKKKPNSPIDANAKPGDLAKYCEGHPSAWSNERLLEEVEKAGDWGGIDPISQLLCGGGNAYDITVGNDDSFAIVGYAKSEFGAVNPPVPEATAKAFATVVQNSVAEVNAVVFRSFGHLIRWLKANDLFQVLVDETLVSAFPTGTLPD